MQGELARDYRSSSIPTESAHEQAAEGCSRFFKVLRVEYPKFFSMAGLYFCIVFAYSILRDTKDAVVIGRMLPASIQYLKSFIVIGATMSFAMVFQFMLSVGITLQTIMFGLNIGFGAFFLGYALVLLPLMEQIEPYMFWINDIFTDGKMAVNGLEFLRGFLLTINFWTGTLLYIAAELWGSVMTSLMFFAIANEICPLRQALRFYPLFIMGANIGLIASGLIMSNASKLMGAYPDYMRVITMGMIVFVSLLCFANTLIYRYIVKSIVPYAIYIVYDNGQKRAKKEKVGMLDGFKIMLKTPIVFHLSITVLAYGICTNLVESAYKSTMQISAKANDKNTMLEVMRLQGQQQMSIGAIVILVLLTPIKTLIQKRGWKSLGMLTPLATGLGGIAFMIWVWGNVSVDATDLAKSNVMVRMGRSVFDSFGWKSNPKTELNIGFMVVNMIKILKYAAFDICKEAIGVKIPKEYKARFKGVYDGVFGKLGKSFSSNIQIVMFLLLNTSDIRIGSGFITVLLMLVCAMWFYSSNCLGNDYNAAVKEDRDLIISETKDKTKDKEEIALAA